MAKIFTRLGYDFNSEKFGDANDPTGELEASLERIKPLLHKWQFDALANNDVSGYLQNPLANTTISMNSYATSMKNFASTVTFDIAGNAKMIGVSTSLVSEISAFQAHCNRISGVTATTDPTLPDFESALGIGEFVQLIVSSYDGIMNNTPVLGSMTSLFVQSELSANLITLTSDSATLNATFTNSLPGGSNSLITIVSNDAICNNINSVTSFLSTRRTADVNYYGKARDLVDDYGKLSRFTAFSPLKLYLTENYVGTDKLKSKL